MTIEAGSKLGPYEVLAPIGAGGMGEVFKAGDTRLENSRDNKTITQDRHVFTHFVLELAIVGRDEPSGVGWWQPLDRIAEAGLPTLYRRAVDAVLKSGPKRSETEPSEQLEEAPSGP